MPKIYLGPIKPSGEPQRPQGACMVPGCPKNVIYARRLCRACYHYAASLVANGHATWERLEDMGLVGYATRPKGYPKRDWRAKHFKDVAPPTGMFTKKEETSEVSEPENLIEPTPMSEPNNMSEEPTDQSEPMNQSEEEREDA